MQGKLMGKAKAKFLHNNELKRVTKQQEGAIDSNYYIQAQMKNAEWRKARIIECRLSKDYDIKQKKVESSYEYYVSYDGINRRMDEWITSDRIRKTNELIDEEPKNLKKHVDKKNYDNQENEEHEGMDPSSLIAHQEATKFKTIDTIEIGKWKCETWYYSPFPEGYQKVECVYFCEFCLHFVLSRNELKRHYDKCILTHPPGDEIYKDDSRNPPISIFEVDGYRNPTYCENLSYLSKLFLDHKNLQYNMDPFLFFVLCENDAEGSHIVGYFSKEKESQQGWNLSCILVLPCHQKKGYGKFLITLSYELSKIEGKVGTPERPLSDLGLSTYLGWWTQAIIDFIKRRPRDEQFCIQDIQIDTNIKDQDILYTLEKRGMIKYVQGQVYISTDNEFLDRLYAESGRTGVPVIVQNIHWIPFKYKWDKENNYYFPKDYDPLTV